MKTLLVSAFACVGVAMVLRADPVMTFDDAASTDGAALGPGYHLLNWTNLAFLDAADYTLNPSGYQAGMVSPKFVIWGGGAGVTSTISGGMFDLLSAYATSAWNDNLQLEAKGYIDGTLVYHQTYTLSATASTLINFDFYGVDEVDFTPSGGTHHAGYTGTGPEFCFDNLSVQTYLPPTPQLLVNGGFETGDFTGWSQTGNIGFTWVTNAAQYVHSGTFGVQFGPTAPGFISQVINPTQISQLYTVSFWLEHPVGNAANSFTVWWGGVPVFGITNAGAFAWTNISLNLPASRLDEFLQFECQDQFNYYGLDDVSVTPTVLVNNGGFETGDFTSWTQTGITNENSVLAASKFVGSFGAQFGAVGGLGSIAQDITSQPGQPYLISAWLENLENPGTQTNRFRVTWGGQVQANSTNLPAAGWTNVHYTVVNGNVQNTLRFAFENDPSFFEFDEASVWPTPLIQNGGFEFGDFTGWTTNGTFNTNVCFMVTNASSGYYGASLGPVGSLGYLSQSVPTVPGQTYLIGFKLNNLASETVGLDFTVSWNGSLLMELTNLNLFGWVPYEFAVTATDTTTTLQFGFRNDPYYWGFDDVFISPITSPEFESISRNGTNFNLTWTEMPGYTYQLQYTTNLNANWTILQTIFSETNIPMSTIDSNPPDPQRFYRLRMLPPPLIF